MENDKALSLQFTLLTPWVKKRLTLSITASWEQGWKHPQQMKSKGVWKNVYPNSSSDTLRSVLKNSTGQAKG